MNIGNAWQDNDLINGVRVTKSIKVKFDDAILTLCPQLTKVKLALFPIPEEQRTKATSPHYRVSLYKPIKPKTEEEKFAEEHAGQIVSEDEIPY